MNIWHWFELSDAMLPSVCFLECALRGINESIFFEYFVIRNGGYCGCGMGEYGRYGLVADSRCNVPCLGDLEVVLCGGSDAYTAFEVEYYGPMMLEDAESVLFNVNENVTVQEASDEKGRDVLSEYEFYFSRFPTKQLSANDGE